MRLPIAIILIGGTASMLAQTAERVTLESCRELALANNKQILMNRQKTETAQYMKKEASSAYLPALDFNGGYLYNQKELSIFDSDQLLPTKTFNPATQEYEFNLAKNPLTGVPIQTADGHYVPETVALIPKEAMTYDIHNVFFGAVTLTQPIYMGGKIRALNKIADYNVMLNEALTDKAQQDVIYEVDAAYWQVVSLQSKYRLAQSYVALLDTLASNVQKMVEQGVATRANKLSVDVKLNSAQVDLVKVENGVSLSRMALANICGLPIDSEMTLADEDRDLTDDYMMPQREYDMADVYSRRQEIRALTLGKDIAMQKAEAAKSSMLPTVAMIGTYSFSNPNMFDGFKKRFSGAFSVGAMINIPLWHWGGNYYKYRQAKSGTELMSLEIEDAKEKVSLQVNQASYRTQESLKTLEMTRKNLASANENLRTAQLAFKEGVAAVDEVMAAQTAWLKANSEYLDAQIDVRMCDTYLKKVLGELQ